MKNYLFLFTVALFTITASCQQSNNVPNAVSEAFQAQYPGENDPDWAPDNVGNWEAHFKQEGIKYRADYLPNGQWVETETSIDEDDLPQAIKDAIEAMDIDTKITEVELVQHHSKGTFYDVEFKQKGKNRDIEFREDGSVL